MFDPIVLIIAAIVCAAWLTKQTLVILFDIKMRRSMKKKEKRLVAGGVRKSGSCVVHRIAIDKEGNLVEKTKTTMSWYSRLL